MAGNASNARLIAARYAGALFDLARDSRAEDRVGEDLEALKQAAGTPEYSRLVATPALAEEARANALNTLLDRIKAQDLTRRFIRTLAGNRRLGVLAEIAASYAELLSAHRGELAAEVTSAHPLSATQAKNIAQALGKSTGKKITLVQKQDSRLLGGFIVTMAGKRADASVLGRLNRLRQQLKITN